MKKQRTHSIYYIFYSTLFILIALFMFYSYALNTQWLTLLSDEQTHLQQKKLPFLTLVNQEDGGNTLVPLADNGKQIGKAPKDSSTKSSGFIGQSATLIKNTFKKPRELVTFETTRFTNSIISYSIIKNDYRPGLFGWKKKKTSHNDIVISEKTGHEISFDDFKFSKRQLDRIALEVKTNALRINKDNEKMMDKIFSREFSIDFSNVTFTSQGLHFPTTIKKLSKKSTILDYQDVGKITSTKNYAQPKTDKLVTLTFDDGPKSDTTPELLETLKKYNVPATFFMLGSSVNTYPETAKLVYDEGFEVASHSLVHDAASAIGPQQVIDYEIENEKAIYKATGTLPTKYRPPYGDINKDASDLLQMPIIQWNIDSQDWVLKDANKIATSVISNTYPGSIILIHDIHKESIKSVPIIINELTKQGYSFVSLDDLIQEFYPGQQYFDQFENRPVA